MSSSRSIVAPLLLASLLAGACGSVPRPDPVRAQALELSAESVLVPPVLVRGEPSAVGPEWALAARMEAMGVPGIGIAVVRGGELAWTGSFGVADAESGRPVTAETLFQAASISKPVAAMGALTLVQEGRLGLDDDVNTTLESWRVPGNFWLAIEQGAVGPVTLRDLLSHTAGLGVHGFPGYPRGAEMPDAVGVLEGRGNTEAVRRVGPPGTERRYSGGGFTVVQVLTVDADGGDRDYATLMRERVLEPLGMHDSTFEQPLPEKLHARAASGHRPDGSVVEGSWHVYPEQAAAGLWTTPADLARFALAVQRGLDGEDGAALPAALVQEMVRAPVEPGYGLGLSLGELRFGHGGGNEGFICSLTAFNEGGNGAVVMTNSDLGWSLQSDVMRTIFAAEGWPGLEPVEKVVVELGPERLAAHVGTYAIQGVGEFQIELAESADRLRFVMPDGGGGELRPESETTFFDPLDGIPVEFISGAGGEVTGFEWEGLAATRMQIED